MTLEVVDGDRGLRLEVSDDGAGLPDAASRRSGVGLSSMRERTEELGGKLSVSPVPEGGTRVSVVFPLPAAPAQRDPEAEGRQAVAGGDSQGEADSVAVVQSGT